MSSRSTFTSFVFRSGSVDVEVEGPAELVRTLYAWARADLAGLLDGDGPDRRQATQAGSAVAWTRAIAPDGSRRDYALTRAQWAASPWLRALDTDAIEEILIGDSPGLVRSITGGQPPVWTVLPAQDGSPIR